jgi:hypothetical protein
MPIPLWVAISVRTVFKGIRAPALSEARKLHRSAGYQAPPSGGRRIFPVRNVRNS